MLSSGEKSKTRKGNRKYRYGGDTLNRVTMEDLTEQMISEQHCEEREKDLSWFEDVFWTNGTAGAKF